MKKFFKELLKGLKWVVISIMVLAAIVASWVGCAWTLGWLVNKFIDLQNFGPENYIPFGSGILVFTLIIQIITVIVTAWFLLAWGRSKNIIKKE